MAGNAELYARDYMHSCRPKAIGPCGLRCYVAFAKIEKNHLPTAFLTLCPMASQFVTASLNKLPVMAPCILGRKVHIIRNLSLGKTNSTQYDSLAVPPVASCCALAMLRVAIVSVDTTQTQHNK